MFDLRGPPTSSFCCCISVSQPKGLCLFQIYHCDCTPSFVFVIRPLPRLRHLRGPNMQRSIDIGSSTVTGTCFFPLGTLIGTRTTLDHLTQLVVSFAPHPDTP
jgi:hypothetical protein